MEWTVTVVKNLSFSRLEAGACLIGNDLLVCIKGGDLPHIGTGVLCVPRPSLSGNGAQSATSSVLNLPGHKDEFICRKVGEMLCSRLNMVVFCTGGFHVDGITKEQIRKVLSAADALAGDLAAALMALL